MAFKLQIVTPERSLFNEEVISVTCPTTMGQITVLAHHAPLLSELSAGELVVRTGLGQTNISLEGGFLKVGSDNTVVILADAAKHIEEINEQEIEAALQRARERLAEESLSSEEYATVAALLERNLSHLHIARKHAHRRKSPITSEGVLEE